MTEALAIGHSSIIVLREFLFHQEEGAPLVIGFPQERVFLEIDKDTRRAIELLSAGQSVGSTAKILRQEIGEDYDVNSLVEFLDHRGLVSSIGSETRGPGKTAGPVERALSLVPPARIAWIHSNWFLLTQIALIAAATIEVARWRILQPHFSDFLFSPHVYVVLLATLAVTLAANFGHELSHFFLARSYGMSARIRLSHRFFYPILVTDLTNTWILHKSQRIRILTAGMLFNLSVVSISILIEFLAFAGRIHLQSWQMFGLRLIAIVNLFPVPFQLFVFARTDVYFMLITMTNERNLASDSMAYVGFRLRRMIQALRRAPSHPCSTCAGKIFADDPFCVKCGAVQPTKDSNRFPFSGARRRLLLATGISFVVGTVLGYGSVLLYGLPFMFLFFLSSVGALNGLAAGWTWSDFADATTMLALAVLQLGFFAYFVTKTLGRLLPKMKRWVWSWSEKA